MTTLQFTRFGQEIDRRIAAETVAVLPAVRSIPSAHNGPRDTPLTHAELVKFAAAVGDVSVRNRLKYRNILKAQTPASIITHNGVFTVKSAASGEHRTFRVKTQKADAKFAPGERIVSLLVGPNNGADYKSFGILKADGHIVVWKKHRDTQIEKLASMLEHLDEHAAKGHVTVQAATTCRRCNRLLSDPISISEGLGPICSGRE